MMLAKSRIEIPDTQLSSRNRLLPSKVYSLLPHRLPLFVKAHELFSEEKEEKDVRQCHEIQDRLINSSGNRNTIAGTGFGNCFAHRTLRINVGAEQQNRDGQQNYVLEFHGCKVNETVQKLS